MFPFLEFCLFIEFEHCFRVIYACKYIKLVQECILNIIYIKPHVKRGAKNLPMASKFP